MSPTLNGRIQTRIFVLVVIGGLRTLLITPVLPAMGELGERSRHVRGARAGDRHGCDLGVRVPLPPAVSLGEALADHVRVITGVPEGILVWLLVNAGWAPGSPEVPGWAFVIHLSTTWLVAFLFLNGPFRGSSSAGASGEVGSFDQRLPPARHPRRWCRRRLRVGCCGAAARERRARGRSRRPPPARRRGGRGAGPAQGRHIARRLVRRLAEDEDGSLPSLAMVCDAADGLAVVLAGDIEVEVERSGGRDRLSGGEAAAWVDRFFGPDVVRLAVRQTQESPTTIDERSDLRLGVAHGRRVPARTASWRADGQRVRRAGPSRRVATNGPHGAAGGAVSASATSNLTRGRRRGGRRRGWRQHHSPLARRRKRGPARAAPAAAGRRRPAARRAGAAGHGDLLLPPALQQPAVSVSAASVGSPCTTSRTTSSRRRGRPSACSSQTTGRPSSSTATT